MGCASSSSLEEETYISSSPNYYRNFPDRFKSLREVQLALQHAGLESSHMMIGIDCTKSNTWTGKKTYNDKCLHTISLQESNPYEQVIEILGKTLAIFDDDGKITVYGFGDSKTTDKAVFSFKTGFAPGDNAGHEGVVREGEGAAVDVQCNGFEDALEQYRSVMPTLRLAGPTSFAPIIYKAIQTVAHEGGYHILVIIADGEMNDGSATADAIVEASNYALSIITIGVGDGPWDTMEHFDDHLAARKFDNFQFVDFNNIMSNPKIENHEAAFAMHALMECPDQYSYVKRSKTLKYIRANTNTTSQTIARMPPGPNRPVGPGAPWQAHIGAPGGPGGL